MATSLKPSLTTVFETLNFYKIKYRNLHSIANSIVVLLKVLITKIQNAERSYFILVNITVLTMNVWYVKMNYTEKCTTVMCSKICV